MRTYRILFGLCLATVFWSGVASNASAQVLLRYQYGNQQTRNYELKQSLKTDSVIAGQKMSNELTQNLLLSSKVDSVQPDGSARMIRKIERCQLQATAPGQTEPMVYDSASPTDINGPFGAIASALGSLVQQEMAMTVCQRGEVSDVDIPSAVQQRLSRSPGGVAGINTPEGLEKMLSQGSIVFPNRAIQVGETWSRELSTELPFGTMKSVIQFRYAGRTAQGLDRIDATTQISLIPKDGSPFDVKMKGADGEGIYLFDPKQGCILASGLKQVMTLELSAAGQTLEQSVTTDISMRLVNGQ